MQGWRNGYPPIYIYMLSTGGGGDHIYIYIYVQSLLELAGAGVSLLGRLFTKEDLPMASTIPLRSDTRRVGTRCSQDSLHFRLLLMFAGWLQCAQDAPCMEWSYALQWRVLQAATLTMHDHRILFGCQCRNSGPCGSTSGQVVIQPHHSAQHFSSLRLGIFILLHTFYRIYTACDMQLDRVQFCEQSSLHGFCCISDMAANSA